MMMWMKLADTVAAKKAKLGLSLRAIEAESGVSRSRLSDLLNRRELGVENYLALCQWLNAHPAKFWTGSIDHSRIPDSNPTGEK